MSSRGPLGITAALTALALLLVGLARQVMPWDKLCPDVICYWTAAELLVSRQSPYDVAAQTETQHRYGWDKAIDGFGHYDFLPYYYPPWLAFLWVPLLPLGYGAAKVGWFFLY